MARKKKETIEQLDASIARWKTRLRRAVNTLGTLEKRRKRLAAKVPASTLVAAVEGHIERSKRPRAHAALADFGATLGPAIREAAEDAGMPLVKVTSHPVTNPNDVKLTFEPVPDIPDFLKRAKEAAADEMIDAAAEAIREEQAATKKAKAAGRIAKMKAKKSGETKRMPVSGKAALDLIRNG